ncbi:MAG TPA: DJ-1/PfpI family protein [Mycobacterium sp.]|jgi:protease I|nr:DJ-1/PfpI family protein [Mycobacterium sp.]
MSETLQGFKIALLAPDGVGQIELETSGAAVRQAGAQTQLVSLGAGYIESLDSDFDPVRRYPVDQTVQQATVDEYDALLLLPAMKKHHQLSGDDTVVSFVRDFIISGKPVGVVCHNSWTLLESGVARGRSLPSYPTMQALRKTGACLLAGKRASSQDLRAFYSTIVEEFARLPGQPTPAPAEETIDHSWARLAVLPAHRNYQKNSAAKEVAGS